MGRKVQVVLQIEEDVISSFVNKYFKNRNRAISVLSLLVEDMLKDIVLGRKEIRVSVLTKESREDREVLENDEIIDPRD